MRRKQSMKKQNEKLLRKLYKTGSKWITEIYVNSIMITFVLLFSDVILMLAHCNASKCISLSHDEIYLFVSWLVLWELD